MATALLVKTATFWDHYENGHTILVKMAKCSRMTIKGVNIIQSLGQNHHTKITTYKDYHQKSDSNFLRIIMSVFEARCMVMS